MCGLNGCRSNHHRMLHQDGADDRTSHNDSTIRADLASASAGGTAEEGERSERAHMATTTMKLTASSEFMALRTVPVYLTS